MRTRREVNEWNARVVERCRAKREQASRAYEGARLALDHIDAMAAAARAAHEAHLLSIRDEAARRQQARQDEIDAIEERRLARLYGA